MERVLTAAPSSRPTCVACDTPSSDERCAHCGVAARAGPYLTRDEIQAVLDAPDPTRRSGIRDRAMLHLAFAAGLRVSELVGLRRDELTFESHAVIRVRGKGRRERTLPLWKETSAALRAWLKVRGDAGASELFLNDRGESMTRSGFEYVLEKHVAVASSKVPSIAKKRISPHVLRHSCAMNILQATHDIRKVALWLGHARVQTSEAYTRADPTEKLDALRVVHHRLRGRDAAAQRRRRPQSPKHLPLRARGTLACRSLRSGDGRGGERCARGFVLVCLPGAAWSWGRRRHETR